MTEQGLIYNVQSFSVHDGPGIRTTVFFKGCNLRCLWCHNPESLEMKKEIQFYPEKCIGCSNCFSICPNHCHMLENDVRSFLRKDCKTCGICANHCYTGSLVLTGEMMTDAQLYQLVEKDKPYYGEEGGVTFSGGECMLQLDFLDSVLKMCKKNRIQTAVDTAGYQKWEKYEQILINTDLFLYDIKAFNDMLHREITGVSNDLILANLLKLFDAKAKVIIRIPCVAGANLEDIPQIADFLEGKPVHLVELLPYHKLGVGKFESLGKTGKNFTTPDNQEMENLARFFRKNNIPVKNKSI